MATYLAQEDEVLQHFLRKIVGAAGPNLKAVVLYGPRLMGRDGQKNAPYNVLTILDEVSPAVRHTLEGAATYMQTHHNVPFWVETITEEEQRRRIRNPKWRRIREQGTVVWPR